MPNPRPLITLTTDFGEGSPYTAQMKGVLLGINGCVTIVDVTHSIPPQDVFAAAAMLRDVAPQFPTHTIHIVVVDPGVGTQRSIICLRDTVGTFVGPDNGVLSMLAPADRPREIVRVSRSKFWREPTSATFHGRDIMAPVAAQLSLGLPIDQLGETTSRFVQLPWPSIVEFPRGMKGEIVWIDSFGNLLTNITSGDLPQKSAGPLTVSCGAHSVQGLSRTYGDAKAGDLVALIGSGDSLELAVVNGNAAARLAVERGDTIEVSW